MEFWFRGKHKNSTQNQTKSSNHQISARLLDSRQQTTNKRYLKIKRSVFLALVVLVFPNYVKSPHHAHTHTKHCTKGMFWFTCIGFGATNCEQSFPNTQFITHLCHRVSLLLFARAQFVFFSSFFIFIYFVYITYDISIILHLHILASCTVY